VRGGKSASDEFLIGRRDAGIEGERGGFADRQRCVEHNLERIAGAGFRHRISSIEPQAGFPFKAAFLRQLRTFAHRFFLLLVAPEK